jgi:hypothetical protein
MGEANVVTAIAPSTITPAEKKGRHLAGLANLKLDEISCHQSA